MPTDVMSLIMYFHDLIIIVLMELLSLFKLTLIAVLFVLLIYPDIPV
jgi:hypothetical protein